MIPVERVGAGRTDEIFAWEDGCILKLYYPEYPADVARTLPILRVWPHYTTRPAERPARRAFADWFAVNYLRRYRQLNPAIMLVSLAPWRAPVAAARLLEGIPEEEAYLLQLAGQPA